MNIDQPLEALNERELEIIPLLAEGLTNREIANRLFLAPNTVKWYVRQLNSKLDTTNREEVVERAEKLGLLHAEKTEDSYVRPRQNIPRQTTPFIGRDAELDEIHQILENPDMRLLTILAQGGMGKTRLALEVLEQQINNFPDGVYFIPLRSLDTPDQIIPAIAEHIYFQFQPGERSPEAQILAFLSNRQMLLCIDNWEHLIEAAPLVNTILKEAPQVKIIATSREKLNLLGETIYVLRGMQFPDWETPEDALEYDAVQLLVQAAQRVQPDWQVTAENLDYVARVCRLTQGMPLGILLAMSWVNMLSIRQIADEIEQSLDFLETDLRDVPERQQSIRAIFNHAWDKLSPSEQAVFMKLSIFRGGFTFEAAREVAGASIRILHRLIEKALVLKLENERFDLHELLRQYGEEKLRESGQFNEIEKDYSHYIFSWSIEQTPSFIGGQIETIKRVYAELGNIHAAWMIAVANHDEDLLRENYTIRVIYWRFGLQSIAIDMWEKALSVVSEENRILRGRLYYELAYYLRFVHQSEAFQVYIRQALDLFEDTDEYSYIARAKLVLIELNSRSTNTIAEIETLLDDIRAATAGRVDSEDIIKSIQLHLCDAQCRHYARSGDLDSAERAAQTGVEYMRELGDAQGLGSISTALATVYTLQGKLAEARRLFLDIHRRGQEIHFFMLAIGTLNDLFFLELLEGNIEAAKSYLDRRHQLESEYGIVDHSAYFQTQDMMLAIYQDDITSVIPVLRENISDFGEVYLLHSGLRLCIQIFLKFGQVIPAMTLLGFHDENPREAYELMHIAVIKQLVTEIDNSPEISAAYEEGKTMDWQTVRQLLEQTLNEVE